MAICKHCGAELEEGLDYCPNCNQSITDDTYSIFDEPAGNLEEDAYSIFDGPEEFNMDELLAKEFQNIGKSSTDVESDFEMPGETSAIEDAFDFEQMFGIPEEEPQSEPAEFVLPTEEEEPELLFDFSDMQEEPVSEESDFILPTEEEPEEVQFETSDGGSFAFPEMAEADFMALDDLFDGMDSAGSEKSEAEVDQDNLLDQGLEDLLAAAELSEAQAKSQKAAKKETSEPEEKKSLWKRLFGNVPVDPSKKKPEPTPEEIAEKKAKEEEEKKKAAEEKKLAATEKKEAAKQAKEEKARQKALAKEEKKAKKLEEAKQILEDMQETRINRLGATIVFALFAVIAVCFIFGSDMFGYSVSVKSAEKSFNLALDNDVKHYNDAYEHIYGLEIKTEDQELNDKIMTVMFVNKELNSYNSFMTMKDYDAALHALLKGIYRYGKYYDQAIPLGIDRDMDFVRMQILKELEHTYRVSEDEAEVLRGMLEAAMLEEDAEKEYNRKLYEIVQESGLLEIKADITE